jgi:predicted dithiol-disulfide oxidoreductase (DUF899 family)
MTSIHSVRFPGENEEYRAARDELLTAELDLRRRVEQVAALRRTLPLGGEPEDYAFEESARGAGSEGEVRTTRLSELFEGGKDNLILYSFMFGPKMERPCPSCTSILDSLDGAAPHVRQRVNLAVVAKSPLPRILSFARERGWRNLRLLSSANTTYNRDYHAETEDGSQLPALNVFVRRRGKIHHFYNTELLYAPPEEGQNPRHVDALWPVWNLFDMTPEGRGLTWYPALRYSV